MKINLKKLKEVKGPVTSEMADAMIEALEEAKQLIECVSYINPNSTYSGFGKKLSCEEWLERFED